MEITLEDVKQFFEANAENEDVKSFLVSLAPEKSITVEQVNAYLQTAEGKALIQPIADKRVTDALKTYRENQFEKEVKEQVAKEILRLNPSETPEQKQIRELREDVEKERKARERDNLRRQVVEEAARRGIPSWWVEDFTGTSLDEAKVFMGKIENSYEDIKSKTRNDLLAEGTYKPGSGRRDDSNKRKVDVSKLSQAELIQLEMEGKLDEALVQ